MSLSELMSAADLDQYAQVALIAFMVAFGLIVWRTFSRRNKAMYEDRARMLPLDDQACAISEAAVAATAPRDRSS